MAVWTPEGTLLPYETPPIDWTDPEMIKKYFPDVYETGMEEEKKLEELRARNEARRAAAEPSPTPYEPTPPPYEPPPPIEYTGGFNIPTDITDPYQERLGGYLDQLEPILGQLTDYIGKMEPISEQYRGILNLLSSPGAFSSAIYPIQKNVNQLLLQNLANRGIISSSIAEKAFTKAAETVPQTYLNQLLNISDVFRKGAQLPLEGMQIGAQLPFEGLRVGAQYTGQELAPYEMMTNILMSL